MGFLEVAYMEPQTLEGQHLNLVRFLEGMLSRDRKAEVAKQAQGCLMTVLGLSVLAVSIWILQFVQDSLGELPGIVNFILLGVLVGLGFLAVTSIFGSLLDTPADDVDELKVGLALQVLQGLPNQDCSLKLWIAPKYFSKVDSGATWFTITGELWPLVDGELSVSSDVEVKRIGKQGKSRGIRVSRQDSVKLTVSRSIPRELLIGLLPPELVLSDHSSDGLQTVLTFLGPKEENTRANGSYSLFASGKRTSEYVVSVVRAVGRVPTP